MGGSAEIVHLHFLSDSHEFRLIVDAYPDDLLENCIKRADDLCRNWLKSGGTDLRVLDPKGPPGGKVISTDDQGKTLKSLGLEGEITLEPISPAFAVPEMPSFAAFARRLNTY
jgi:hypothetical protein